MNKPLPYILRINKKMNWTLRFVRKFLDQQLFSSGSARADKSLSMASSQSERLKLLNYFSRREVRSIPLVLCRTPFQAVMLRQVLLQEKEKHYDLVYFSQDNSQEDKYYFALLSEDADEAQYIFIQKQKIDILNHFLCYKKVLKNIKHYRYRKVIFSSFDNLAFLKLAHHQKQIISFDDGLGHILGFSSTQKFKSRLYRTLLQLPSDEAYIRSIETHYSIYPMFTHIFPKHILRYVDLFELSKHQENGKGLTFFIGQPFSDYMDGTAIAKIEEHLNQYEVNYYVKHPRELNTLLPHVPLLDKKGLIAEEAIFNACGKYRPLLIGSISSVLINISSVIADKIVLLIESEPSHKTFYDIAKKAGCHVVYLK